MTRLARSTSALHRPHVRTCLDLIAKTYADRARKRRALAAGGASYMIPEHYATGEAAPAGNEDVLAESRFSTPPLRGRLGCMGNRKPSKFLLQNQDVAAWERVCSAVRPAACDLDMPGIGERRLQLIVCSTFEHDEKRAWEIRQLEEAWWLFRSEVVESWPNVRLIDYRPIPVEPALLSTFFTRVTAL
jgi:hypothetical protein